MKTKKRKKTFSPTQNAETGGVNPICPSLEGKKAIFVCLIRVALYCLFFTRNEEKAPNGWKTGDFFDTRSTSYARDFSST